MNFGAIDTLGGGAGSSTATINISCTGALLTSPRILICPGIDAGSGGASSAAARQMLNGTSSLNYQLYADSGHSLIWGSNNWAYPALPPVYSNNLNILGYFNDSITLYGGVFGGQGAAAPGSFVSNFTTASTHFIYRYSTDTSCAAPSGTLAGVTFAVNATVAANCLVSVGNINFGNNGVLNHNVDATGSVTATCTAGTPYTISLGPGSANAGPTARKMVKGAEAVTYGLYKDTTRSQPWGDANTAGSTVAGTGTGSAQVLTVYGRVPPQTTPTPGTYTDTVVVTLTY
jgi:spore coat protein U-like protein